MEWKTLVWLCVCCANIKFGESQHPKLQNKLMKVAMTQKGYIQFLKYKVDVPPLRQFTFCIWIKSHNLSHAHPIFSYSRYERDKYVRSAITKGGFKLKTFVMEQKLLDVTVDLDLYRWYHICQSWDSTSGKWQVYLNGRLVNQGVHKNLRDAVIPGGGDIVIGQEYTDFDKGLDEGIEGEVFGFNMILSSTTEEPNHKYYHSEIKDSKIASTDSSFDVYEDYVRLVDLDNPGKSGKIHANASEVTFEIEDDLDDILSPPKTHDIPFWNLINKAGREGRFRTSEAQPLAVNNLPTYETPPSLPVYDAPKMNPSFEMQYARENFKGNQWYDQNEYFPKELLRPKGQNKPRAKYGVPKDSHPYATQSVYEHVILRRDIREKNVEILNPESLIVYPVAKAINVQVFPRGGDPDSVEFAETSDDESYEVQYSRLHYTGGRDKQSPMLPIGFIRNNQRYPQSITDKINEPEHFEKSVKLGNALNEIDIFRKHGNDRISSFVGSIDRIPDINKYRSDIDNVDFNQNKGPKSAGRKLVELGYKKCLQDAGSILAKDAASLISWTLTPMRIFGGANLREATPSCGAF